MRTFGSVGLGLGLGFFSGGATAAMSFSCSCGVRAATMASLLRCSVEYQWFLMELSVLPGSSLAISVHRLPYLRCAIEMCLSSSSVHGSFLMAGSS